MVEDSVVSIRYRPLKPTEAFFIHGRPLVDPKRPRLYLSRRFDFILLVGLVISLLAVFTHILLALLTMPEVPVATNYVTSQCANMEGEWNKDKSVLRFWSVPYALPPVMGKETTFPEVLNDINVKFQFRTGGFRWYPTIGVPNAEYCFLSFDDRCSFERSQWTCEMRRPVNRSSTCVELDGTGANAINTTENCLYLDIAMPIFTGTLLPVIVVFTGFRSIRNPVDPKAKRQAAYLPTDNAIINFGAIWVNARIRVGPFGSFYDLNEFGDLNAKIVGTNYTNFGLRDQRAVLMWVRSNIGRFGGDRDKVVVLAHDTGATGMLQLIQMQSALTEPWFRAAWLSSGSLNWYDGTTTGQILLAREALLALGNCDYGDDQKLLIHQDDCADKLRKKLISMDLNELTRHFKELYNEEEFTDQIWKMQKFDEQEIRMWFAVDKEFDNGPPIDWTDGNITNMFYTNENRSTPSLVSLVFSSMQSEYEGMKDLSDIDSSELSSLLVDTSRSEQDVLFEKLGRFERHRARSFNAWPRKLSETEYRFNVLSAMRYTCPQSWLLGKWLFGQKGYLRTNFYQIYHEEAPRYPFSSIPGIKGTRRLPFHGMDMLIITGNYQEQQSSTFTAYKDHLWRMFDDFVHNFKVDEKCKAIMSGDGKTMKPAFGCQLNAFGPTRPRGNLTLDLLCNQIDWTQHFKGLAAYE